MSVTTYEALRACIEEACLVICIEEPLYYEIRDSISKFAEIQDYDITYYDALAFIMLKKTRGVRRFDDEHFSIYYYALHGN